MIDRDALTAAARELYGHEPTPEHERLVAAYLLRAGFRWERTNVVSDTQGLERRLVGQWSACVSMAGDNSTPVTPPGSSP